jgi:hypothetical protein
MKVSFHRRKRRQLGWIAVGLAVAAVSVPAAAARPVLLPASTGGATALGHPDESARVVRPPLILGHPDESIRVVRPAAIATYPDESARVVRPVVTPQGPTVLRRTGPVRVIEPQRTPVRPATGSADDGVDWTDAGVGAGVGLALGLGLLSATMLAARRRRMMAHPS